jgi:hypothetical protein
MTYVGGSQPTVVASTIVKCAGDHVQQPMASAGARLSREAVQS